MNKKVKNLFALAGLLAALFGIISFSKGNPGQLPSIPPASAVDSAKVSGKFSAKSVIPTLMKETPSPLSRGIHINEKQGEEITLTLAEVSMQKIEKWIRVSGSIDSEAKFVRGRVYGKDRQLIRVGQKVRIFPLVAREPVLQGRVARTFLNGNELIVETGFQPRLYEDVQFYIMEIIVDLGRHLAVPNEAIIEEKGRRLVYIQQADHLYSPKELVSGFRGELYTQVLDGPEPGEKAVTFGSFFIDAHYKLQKMNGPGGLIDSSKGEENSFNHHH